MSSPDAAAAAEAAAMLLCPALPDASELIFFGPGRSDTDLEVLASNKFNLPNSHCYFVCVGEEGQSAHPKSE